MSCIVRLQSRVENTFKQKHNSSFTGQNAFQITLFQLRNKKWLPITYRFRSYSAWIKWPYHPLFPSLLIPLTPISSLFRKLPRLLHLQTCFYSFFHTTSLSIYYVSFMSVISTNMTEVKHEISPQRDYERYT